MSSILENNASKALLMLFKDFSQHYNANSLSKALHLTPRGTLKLLKRLEGEAIVRGSPLGKAIFYKANLDDSYTRCLISLLLMGEAKQHASRWLSEFREVFNTVEIAVLFGSAAKGPGTAHDTDLLLVFDEKREKEVDAAIGNRRALTARPIHPVKQSPEDFRKNLRKGDKVLLGIVRHGIVLTGYDLFVSAIEEITRLP